ncbi:hypothetical protein [Desertibaculum subflavum]|uniref:hypothetical protein n=1 Tax=Desertibaculum subflavum TaxID=2268458 RepID=UPI0013C4B268
MNAAPRGPISSAGIFLIVVGALLAVPSGACTGMFAYMVVTEWGDAAEAASTMGLVLMIAGLPLAGGIALIWVGLKQRKPI